MSTPSGEERRVEPGRVEQPTESQHVHSPTAKSAQKLTYLRTLDILSRMLPPPPCSIVDMGGQNGAYATWLRGRGYEVHLLDRDDQFLEQTRSALAAIDSDIPWSVRISHPTILPFEIQSADVVLCLGPLHHLQTRDERLLALCEIRRVLKTDGFTLTSAISRFASVLDGMTEGLLDDPGFVDTVLGDLSTGKHTASNHDPSGASDAYFHRPEELVEEMCSAGLIFEGLIAIEGPGWARRNLDDVLSDVKRRRRLFELLQIVEGEMSLMGASPHFFGVARKMF